MRITVFDYPARRWFFSIMVLLLLGMSGCAVFNPGPKTISVSQVRLQQLIGSQFPYNSRVLGMLDVLVSNPRMKLDGVNNRITMALDLGLSAYGLGTLLINQPLQGALDMSYGLRFEPSDNTVRMTDVRISSLQVKGATPQLQNTINQLAPVLAERVLNDYSLYKLSEKDLSAAKGWSYKPGSLTVGNDGLNITLDPITR